VKLGRHCCHDRTIETETKVPVRGEIPILGKLFTHRNKKKVKTNMLVVLTPCIIHDQSDLRRILREKQQEQERLLEPTLGRGPDALPSAEW
jgi:general secretion pathway protein D